MKSFFLCVLVALALASFGYRMYLLKYTPDDIQVKCAHAPLDFFYKHQYTDCLARDGR